MVSIALGVHLGLLGGQGLHAAGGQTVSRFLPLARRRLMTSRPARVDMRYSNGLAVSWSGARLAARGAEGPEALAHADPEPTGWVPAARSLNHPGSPEGALGFSRS
jgi:hypothetical protein